MSRNLISKSIPVITVITYFVMVLVNVLANSIPINGRGTGEISDSYENLFAPAGITFSIWGLIYILLLGFTIYQLTYYRDIEEDKKRLFEKIGLTFSLSSVANTLWIFTWHYDYIKLSLLIMISILICLIRINFLLRNKEFNSLDKVLIRLPFSIYFGWITVATIANATIFLVAIGWSRFGLPEYLWANIIILIGAIIGVLAMIFYKIKSYGVVIIWAYLGILIKHISPNGFNGMYFSVIATVIVSIIILMIGEVSLINIQIKRKHIISKSESKGEDL